MSQTISVNGKNVDLTQICSPFGLQPPAVQAALKEGAVETFSAGAGWVTAPAGHRNYAMTYRRKPEATA